MNRTEAHKILKKYMQNANLLKHSYAAEAAMRGLYRHLTPKNEQNTLEEETWGITGLLHDVDYEVAQKTNQLEKHGMLLFEKGELTLPDEIAHGIKAHNYPMTQVMPETQMDWAITASDQLTGLIVACALVRPDKSLRELTTESVLKKFNMSAFAKGASRESILQCESELEIPLKEFIAIVLASMQEIHTDLGL